MKPSPRAIIVIVSLLAALALVPLALSRSASNVGPSTPLSLAAGEDGTAPAVAQQMRATATAPAATDTIDASRRTAIVRAAERVAPAVVSVNVTRRETVQPRSIWEDLFVGPGGSREVLGLGSGFIIDASGLALTNEHVVRGASQVVVTTADGQDYDAQVVGTDEVTDLALLRLTDPKGRLSVAPLGTSKDLVIGEWVVAIGNPFGFLLSNPEPTVTAGVVSGVARNIIPGDASRGYYLDMIQTDASINPGNSGGPLVNALGQVIGVNSSIISESGGSVGLGFAIPIDRARRVAKQLLEEKRVRRVWVGVEMKPSNPNRFGRSQHIEVGSVAPGSPAARAGFRSGQLVQSVAGRPVRTPLDWEARLLDTSVGESIDVVVEEDGRQRTLRVGTQDLPSLTAERVRALSDFELVTLTNSIRAERGLSSEQGALIVSLSDAARNLGLRQGDLIVQINRTPITTAQEAASLMGRLAGRGTVRVIFERDGQLGSASFYVGG